MNYYCEWILKWMSIYEKKPIYKHSYECTYIIGTSKYYPAKEKSLIYSKFFICINKMYTLVFEENYI